MKRLLRLLLAFDLVAYQSQSAKTTTYLLDGDKVLNLQADFNTRRQIIELLDIRGKIAFENGEKVIYLKCLIEPQDKQPLLPIQILPSSNSHEVNTIELTARLVLRQGVSIVDSLFNPTLKPKQSEAHRPRSVIQMFCLGLDRDRIDIDGSAAGAGPSRIYVL